MAGFEVSSGLSHYQQLGVARTATAHEVRRAYLELARQLHPDKCSAPDAALRFIRINEDRPAHRCARARPWAWETLSKTHARRAYDLYLDTAFSQAPQLRMPSQAARTTSTVCSSLSQLLEMTEDRNSAKITELRRECERWGVKFPTGSLERPELLKFVFHAVRGELDARVKSQETPCSRLIDLDLQVLRSDRSSQQDAFLGHFLPTQWGSSTPGVAPREQGRLGGMAQHDGVLAERLILLARDLVAKGATWSTPFRGVAATRPSCPQEGQAPSPRGSGPSDVRPQAAQEARPASNTCSGVFGCKNPGKRRFTQAYGFGRTLLEAFRRQRPVPPEATTTKATRTEAPKAKTRSFTSSRQKPKRQAEAKAKADRSRTPRAPSTASARRVPTPQRRASKEAAVERPKLQKKPCCVVSSSSTSSSSRPRGASFVAMDGAPPRSPPVSRPKAKAKAKRKTSTTQNDAEKIEESTHFHRGQELRFDLQAIRLAAMADHPKALATLLELETLEQQGRIAPKERRRSGGGGLLTELNRAWWRREVHGNVAFKAAKLLLQYGAPRYEDNCKYAHSGGPSPGFTANVNPPPPPEKRELTAQEEETAAEALLSTPGMAKAEGVGLILSEDAIRAVLGIPTMHASELLESVSPPLPAASVQLQLVLSFRSEDVDLTEWPPIGIVHLQDTKVGNTGEAVVTLPRLRLLRQVTSRDEAREARRHHVSPRSPSSEAKAPRAPARGRGMVRPGRDKGRSPSPMRRRMPTEDDWSKHQLRLGSEFEFAGTWRFLR
eukprot:g1811.t1